MRVNLYIPTLNGGKRFLELLDRLERQTLPLQRCVIIDSGSMDGTVAAAQTRGFEVIGLGSEGFDHGGTRQRAIDAYPEDRKSTRLNSSHVKISYAVFCLKKKK